jgi:hypothetical protein
MSKTIVRVLLLLLPALTGPARAGADYFTVGPDGDYATIQAALTRAAQTPVNPTSLVSHRILVQRGTYPENLRLPVPCCTLRWIHVSGGWNATFSSQDTDPTATVVNGRDRGRVLTASLSGGTLTLERLVLKEGYLLTGTTGFTYGAGLQASLSGTAALNLSLVHVRDNVIRGDGPGDAEAQGAGASVVLSDSARLRVYQSRFENNLTVPGGSALASYGGGLNVQVEDASSAIIQRSEFAGNWAYGSRFSNGGGVYAMVERGAGAGFVLEDTTFTGNVVHNSIGHGAGLELRMLAGDAGSTSRITRCRFLSNLVGGSQLSASVSGGTRVDVTDTLVARGRGGVKLLVNNSVANASNLTVADNQLRGIVGSVAGGRLTVFNTIAFANAGGDLALSGMESATGFNLVGIDPRFNGGSYELDGGSPAADAGTNTPPAGLGRLDLGRRPRVYNGTVDIGAYEWVP